MVEKAKFRYSLKLVLKPRVRDMMCVLKLLGYGVYVSFGEDGVADVYAYKKE